MAIVTRRNFMNITAATGVVGLSKSLFPDWMPRMAFRGKVLKTAPGDVLVVIFQRGGMDGLNVVVPYGDDGAYYDKRPTIAIPAPNGSDNSAIDLDGHFGLHPALRPLKDIFDANRLAVIHAAGSPDPSRSHFDAMEFMERGTPGDKVTGTGWVNRHLQTAAWQNESPFRAVGMGAIMQTALRGPVSALALKSIADFHLGGRGDQLTVIQRTLGRLYNIQAPADALGTQASEVFATMELLTKLAATKYEAANDAQYPETDYGLGLKQIAQLIKAGVGLEVACVDIGGWDTHQDEGGEQGQMAALLEEFARGLRAFYQDLGSMIAGVTLVTMSEFGRRAEENASHGTDHGHGNVMFVMGGGVNGGVHTNWPGLTPDKLDDGDLAITTDYRAVLSEILMLRLLNPAIDKIFPGYQPTTPGIVRKR